MLGMGAQSSIVPVVRLLQPREWVYWARGLVSKSLPLSSPAKSCCAAVIGRMVLKSGLDVP